MKGLKTFDFFQKISIDNVSQPSIIGAIISLSAISMIVFLLLREAYNFLTPTIQHDTIIYNDPRQTEKIHVGLELDFPNLPCELVSVDQEDMMGNHRLDIHDTLIKNRFTAEKGILPDVGPNNYRHAPIGQLLKAIDNKEGCSVTGYVNISKVPGDVHISFHSHPHLFEHLKIHKPELLKTIGLNHRFKRLNFGDPNIDDDVLARFGFDESNTFDRLENLPNFANFIANKNFDYYLKLIPHLLVDEIRGIEYVAYQYSLTSRMKEFNLALDGMPVVVMQYDMSPITMKITLNHQPLAHTLTHVCAIVGGVFVIFSLLNRIILTFCSFASYERKTIGIK
jgi:hypothetical protein